MHRTTVNYAKRKKKKRLFIGIKSTTVIVVKLGNIYTAKLTTEGGIVPIFAVLMTNLKGLLKRKGRK